MLKAKNKTEVPFQIESSEEWFFFNFYISFYLRWQKFFVVSFWQVARISDMCMKVKNAEVFAECITYICSIKQMHLGVLRVLWLHIQCISALWVDMLLNSLLLISLISVDFCYHGKVSIDFITYIFFLEPTWLAKDNKYIH